MPYEELNMIKTIECFLREEIFSDIPSFIDTLDQFFA